MNAPEITQLALAQKDIEYMKERLDKLDKKIDRIIDKLDENEKKEQTYLTKKGLYKFTTGIVGLTLSLVTLFYIIYDHLKGGS